MESSVPCWGYEQEAGLGFGAALKSTQPLSEHFWVLLIRHSAAHWPGSALAEALRPQCAALRSFLKLTGGAVHHLDW